MTTRVKKSTWRSQDNLLYTNILDHGAVSGEDCTTAITAAIETGLPIYIPYGIFYSDPFELDSGQVLFGEGENSILIQNPNSSDTFITCADHCQIRYLCIDGNIDNQDNSNLNAINASGLFIEIRNCIIQNVSGNGIYIATSSQKIFITDNTITNYLGNGISVVDCIDCTITGNYIYLSDIIAFPGNGISFEPTTLTTIKNVLISNNTIKQNTGRGISITGNGSQNIFNAFISTNALSQNTSHGLYVYSAIHIFITNCMALNNAGDGFRFEGNTTYCRLSESLAKDNAGYGIREVVATDTPDFNGFIYNVTAGNGNNTITKVGTSSFIV